MKGFGFGDLVNDLKATFLDDLDALANMGGPKVREVFEPVTRALGPVDRKRKRLTPKQKAKLSRSTIRRGVRSAFGGAMQAADAEVQRRARPVREVKSADVAEKPRAKRKRKMGPEE